MLLRPTALLLLLVMSCSGGSAPDTAPDPDPDSSDQARVRIENRASHDMDIFLLRSDGNTVRLGYIAGGETATYALPATLTAGTTSIRFEARPVRRAGESVVSEPFGVRMGEEITWSISPQ